MINEPWGIVAILGFWSWVFSTIGFIFKAFPRRKLFIPKAGVLWGAALLLSFGVWLVGMMNA